MTCNAQHLLDPLDEINLYRYASIDLGTLPSSIPETVRDAVKFAQCVLALREKPSTDGYEAELSAEDIGNAHYIAEGLRNTHPNASIQICERLPFDEEDTDLWSVLVRDARDSRLVESSYHTADPVEKLAARPRGPYGVRRCRDHWHVTAYDEDLIEPACTSCDAALDRANALNREWAESTESAPTCYARACPSAPRETALSEELGAAIERYADAKSKYDHESDALRNSWRQTREDEARTEMNTAREVVASLLARLSAPSPLCNADALIEKVEDAIRLASWLGDDAFDAIEGRGLWAQRKEIEALIRAQRETALSEADRATLADARGQAAVERVRSEDVEALIAIINRLSSAPSAEGTNR